MTRVGLIISFFILLIMNACKSSKKSEGIKNIHTSEILSDDKIAVPFVEAKNYYIRNDYKDSTFHILKITTQNEFYNIFGMATTMGKEGKPTPIDFSKQYIIACIAKIASNIGAIEVTGLTKIKKAFILTYHLSEIETQSFTSRHLKVLIIDNQYQGVIELQKK